MANLIHRRSISKKDRALRTAGKASGAAVKLVKARIAWLAGKKVARVAAPALAVGTAAFVARRRGGSGRTPAAA